MYRLFLSRTQLYLLGRRKHKLATKSNASDIEFFLTLLSQHLKLSFHCFLPCMCVSDEPLLSFHLLDLKWIVIGIGELEGFFQSYVAS
jgi:hypothetical protein